MCSFFRKSLWFLASQKSCLVSFLLHSSRQLWLKYLTLIFLSHKIAVLSSSLHGTMSSSWDQRAKGVTGNIRLASQNEVNWTINLILIGGEKQQLKIFHIFIIIGFYVSPVQWFKNQFRCLFLDIWLIERNYVFPNFTVL